MVDESDESTEEQRWSWRTEIARAIHRMPLVPAVVLVMLGIGLTEWTQPRNVWPLAVPAIGLSIAAVVALKLQQRVLSMGLAWFALLWGGATCHYFQTGETDDTLSRRASPDYQPLVFRAEIIEGAIWRPNFYYRPGQDESQRWRTQWKVRCFAIRDGLRWQALNSFSALSVAGRIEHLLPGDRLTVYGSCAAVPPPSNPGESDLRRVFRSERHFVFLRAESSDQIVRDETRWSRPVARTVAISVRQIDRAFRQHVPLGQAPLAAALIFGQRQQVDWDEQQELLSTGTLHMLAISGMHIELVAGTLWLFCLLVGFRQRTALIIVATTVTAYALIAGANPPVLRAVFVVLAVCVARWRGRRRGLANLLAFSALAVLALRTSWIGNVGVQLSFLAVATIAVFAQGINQRRQRNDALLAVIEETWSWRARAVAFVRRWAWRMACLSFWVWLMTAPLIWLNFHVVSLIAIPLNIFLWPFLVVGLLSGLALAVLWWVPALASILGLTCGLSLWLIGGIVSFGDWIALGHVWLPAPTAWWTTIFYAVAAGGVLLVHYRPVVRPWLGVVLLSWLALGVAPWLFGQRGHGPAWLRTATARICETVSLSTERTSLIDRDLRVTFIDVGHGTSVMFEIPNGEVWLYDAGHLGSSERSHQEIANALWHMPTARIDRLFLSHADADHYNAVPGLLERFSIGEVIATEQFWLHAAPELGELRAKVHEHGIPAGRVAEGEQLESGPEGGPESSPKSSPKRNTVRIEVLHPPGGWNDKLDNANSLTILVHYAGRSCLLPGDLEKHGLRHLLSGAPRDCDVLMAPHHGSLTHDPRNIYRWCQPEWIVISGGQRAARPQAVQRYTLPGAQTAITHRDGAIQVRVSDSGELGMWHWNVTNWKRL